MALLPYGDENKDASAETLEALKRPYMLNVAKMIANSEPCFKEFGKLGGALFTKAKLAPKLLSAPNPMKLGSWPMRAWNARSSGCRRPAPR
jgi:hypothetical protein